MCKLCMCVILAVYIYAYYLSIYLSDLIESVYMHGWNDSLGKLDTVYGCE